MIKIKRLFNKLALRVLKRTCEHNNKKVKWIDYPDAYIHYYCDECKSDIYEGLYDG